MYIRNFYSFRLSKYNKSSQQSNYYPRRSNPKIIWKFCLLMFWNERREPILIWWVVVCVHWIAQICYAKPKLVILHDPRPCNWRSLMSYPIPLCELSYGETLGYMTHVRQNFLRFIYLANFLSVSKSNRCKTINSQSYDEDCCLNERDPVCEVRSVTKWMK